MAVSFLQVLSTDKILELLHLGNSRRKTESTEANGTSSRWEKQNLNLYSLWNNEGAIFGVCIQKIQIELSSHCCIMIMVTLMLPQFRTHNYIVLSFNVLFFPAAQWFDEYCLSLVSYLHYRGSKLERFPPQSVRLIVYDSTCSNVWYIILLA